MILDTLAAMDEEMKRLEAEEAARLTRSASASATREPVNAAS